MANGNQILWSIHYEPVNCPVHSKNPLSMAAPPEFVWAWLIRAPTHLIQISVQVQFEKI